MKKKTKTRLKKRKKNAPALARSGVRPWDRRRRSSRFVGGPLRGNAVFIYTFYGGGGGGVERGMEETEEEEEEEVRNSRVLFFFVVG